MKNKNDNSQEIVKKMPKMDKLNIIAITGMIHK